jgi:hypothetical protein
MLVFLISYKYATERTVVIGAVESVENRLKVMGQGSCRCVWRRITVRKSEENGRCGGMFTVFFMPGDGANVENIGSGF